MDLKGLIARIGQKGTIDSQRQGVPNGAMKFQVEVMNVKLEYGKARYHVRPVSGEGAAWVENVTFNES